jgi:hypothetical protein
MPHHNNFILSIHQRNHLEVCFNSKEKGVITRICVPFDFGPSGRYKDGLNRYHFYDLNSPDGKHNLSILSEQLVSLKILDENFDPKTYVTWSIIKWHVKRDWGMYS